MTLKGCERDIAETVKAKTLSLETAGQLEERIVAVKPVLAKIGPMYKANGKELVDRIKGHGPGELREGGLGRERHDRARQWDGGHGGTGHRRDTEVDGIAWQDGRDGAGGRYPYRDRTVRFGARKSRMFVFFDTRTCNRNILDVA